MGGRGASFSGTTSGNYLDDPRWMEQEIRKTKVEIERLKAEYEKAKAIQDEIGNSDDIETLRKYEPEAVDSEINKHMRNGLTREEAVSAVLNDSPYGSGTVGDWIYDKYWKLREKAEGAYNNEQRYLQGVQEHLDEVREANKANKKRGNK